MSKRYTKTLRFLSLLGLACTMAVTTQWGTIDVAAAAVSDSVIADWEMNEPQGATTMTDLSGNGLNGAIGSTVVVDGAGTYSFPAKSTAIGRAREVVIPATLPSTSLLNPGLQSRHFTIEARVLIPPADIEGKIFEKGQANTVGGYTKFAYATAGTATAHPLCFFRDSAGVTTSIRPMTVTVNDGQWHTLICERTDTGVALTVDGVRYFHAGVNGNVTNSKDAVLGGKAYCNVTTVDCDYFNGGNMDYVKVYAQDIS